MHVVPDWSHPHIQSDPVLEQEIGKFFSAPGYYGTDVSAMCTYEKGRCTYYLDLIGRL